MFLNLIKHANRTRGLKLLGLCRGEHSSSFEKATVLKGKSAMSSRFQINTTSLISLGSFLVRKDCSSPKSHVFAQKLSKKKTPWQHEQVQQIAAVRGRE